MTRAMGIVAALVVTAGVCASALLAESPADEKASSSGRQSNAAAQQAPADAHNGRTLVEAANELGVSTPDVVATLERALQRQTKPAFDNTPLADVVAYYSHEFDVNIVLNAKGLADAAVDPSAPVSWTLHKPVTLEAALHLILEEFDLTFVIQDEVLKITSKDKADECRTSEVYPVGDLIGPPPGSFGTIIQVITSSVNPDSWDDVGGPNPDIQVGPGYCLVITQTREGHAEIRNLLAKIRATAKDSLASRDHLTTVSAYRVPYGTGQQTAEALKNIVVPKSWSEQGGDGSVQVVSPLSPQPAVAPTGTPGTAANSTLPPFDLLVVRQREDIQSAIRNVLREAGYGMYAGGMGMGGMSGRMGGNMSGLNLPPPTGVAVPQK